MEKHSEDSNPLPLHKLNSRVSVLWNITLKCNLSCKHCFVGHKRSYDSSVELSKDDIILMIENIVSRFVTIKEFNIQGGEPTISNNLTLAIRTLGEKQIPWSINSNGVSWKDEHFEAVSSYPPAGITFSLDGHNSRTHDWLRGKGVFNSLMETIRKLKNIDGGIPFDAICVLNKKNIKSFHEILDFANELGVRELVFMQLSPSGNAIKHLDELTPESADMFEVLSYICKTKGVYNGMLVYLPWATPIMIDYYNKLHETEIPILGATCQAVRGELTISHKGNLLPCPNALDRLNLAGNTDYFSEDKHHINLVTQDLQRIRTSYFFNEIYQLLHGDKQAPRISTCLHCPYNTICFTCPSERALGYDTSAKLCSDFQKYAGIN